MRSNNTNGDEKPGGGRKDVIGGDEQHPAAAPPAPGPMDPRHHGGEDPEGYYPVYPPLAEKGGAAAAPGATAADYPPSGYEGAPPPVYPMPPPTLPHPAHYPGYPMYPAHYPGYPLLQMPNGHPPPVTPVQTEENLKRQVLECRNMDVFTKKFAIKKSDVDLKQEEIEARIKWNERREELVDSGVDLSARAHNLTEVLSSIVVPPFFSTSRVETTNRSKATEKRKKWHYCPEIKLWETFKPNIEDITRHISTGDTNNGSNQKSVLLKPLMTSLMSTAEVREENDEQHFLADNLWGILLRAGLMFEQEELDSSGRDAFEKRNTIIGLPDHKDFSEDGKKVIAMVEVMASHTLATKKKDYEEAFTEQNAGQTNVCPIKWYHLCHPLEQLYAYMIDNNVRFGALCSASKTYFCFFEGDDDIVVDVRVTDAYLTIGTDYVVSWAWFLQEARKGRYQVPHDKNLNIQALCNDTNWLESTPIGKAPAKKDTKKMSTHASIGGPGRGGRSGRGSDRGSGRGGGYGRGGGSSSSTKRRKVLSDSSGMPHNTPKQGGQTRPSDAENKAKKASSNSNSSDSSPSIVGSDLSIPISLQSQNTDTYYPFEAYFLKKSKVPFFNPSRIGKVLGRGRNGDVFETDFGGVQVAVKQFDLSKNFKSYKRELEGYIHLQKVWGELVPSPKFIGSSRSGMVRFLGLPKGTVPDDGFKEQLGEIYCRLREEYNFLHLDSSHGQNGILIGDKVLAIDLEFWDPVPVEKNDFLTQEE